MKQPRTAQTSPGHLLTSSTEKRNTKSNESSHTDNSDDQNGCNISSNGKDTQWKGYPESDNTWEPADQVHAPEIIKHYQSAGGHQSSAAHLQSAIKKEHQSAPLYSHIKTLKTLPHLSIECPTIFLAFPSNAFQKISPFKTSLPSNAPNTTSTPPNRAPTASSASATSSAPTTYQYIAGIVNCPTAPFITVTSPCRISLTMTLQNPPAPQATEDPCYDTTGSSGQHGFVRRLCDPRDDTKSFGPSVGSFVL